MQDLASEFSKIFRGSYSRTLTRPGVGTRTVGPLNFSAVVAPLKGRIGWGGRRRLCPSMTCMVLLPSLFHLWQGPISSLCCWTLVNWVSSSYFHDVCFVAHSVIKYFLLIFFGLSLRVLSFVAKNRQSRHFDNKLRNFSAMLVKFPVTRDGDCKRRWYTATLCKSRIVRVLVSVSTSRSRDRLETY